MQDGYKTLEKEASDSFIIKKSRFTGYGSPARSGDTRTPHRQAR